MVSLPPWDAIYYSAAARSILSQVSPYIYENFVLLVGQIDSAAKPYLWNYAPPALFWFLPLGLFEIETAASLWRMMLILSYLIGLNVFYEILKSEKLTKDKQLLLWFGPTVILFPLADIMWSNCTSLVFLFYVLILRALYFQQSDIYRGILFSLLILKPHLFIPLGVFLSIQSLMARKMSFFVGLAVGIMIQLVPVIIFVPDIFESYLASLPNILSASKTFWGISLFSSLYAIFGWTNPTRIGLFILILLGVFLFFIKKSDFEKGLYVMPVAILVAPHANVHVVVLLAPIFWYLLSQFYYHNTVRIAFLNLIMIALLAGSPFVYLYKLFEFPILILLLMIMVLAFSIVGLQMLIKEDTGATKCL